MTAWVDGGSGVVVSADYNNNNNNYYYYYYYYYYVVVAADWGDDSCCTAVSCVDDSDYNVVTFVVAYETLGTLSVAVTASNLISRKAADNQTIAVYERIRDCPTL